MTAPPRIEPPQAVDSLVVVKALTEVSAVLLALTFVGGWSYLAAYYRTFGLNPLELEFSSSVFSTLAVYVLSKSLWPILIFLAIITVLAVIARRLHRLERSWVAVALSVLLFVVVIAAVHRGRSMADEDMLVESSSLPNVAFATKTKIGAFPCVEVGNFGSSDCKLLLHTKGAYYFFLPVPAAGVGSLNLYMLPESEIAASHLLRGLDRSVR